MSGNLDPRIREVIIRLMRLADAEEPIGSVSMTETLPVMMQLNMILSQGSQQTQQQAQQPQMQQPSQQQGQNPMMNPALLKMLLGNG